MNLRILIFICALLLLVSLVRAEQGVEGERSSVETVDPVASETVPATTFNEADLLDEIVSEIKETAAAAKNVEPEEVKEVPPPIVEAKKAEPVKPVKTEPAVPATTSSGLLQPFVNAFSALVKMWCNIIRSIASRLRLI